MSKAKKVAAGRRSSAQLDGNVGIRCARLPGQSFPRDQTFANRRSQTKPSICWLLLTLLLSPFTTSAQTPSSPLAVPSASWGAGIGVPHVKRNTTQRFQLASSFSETSRQETWNAWLNWHTLRRTHITLFQVVGCSLRNAQAQLWDIRRCLPPSKSTLCRSPNSSGLQSKNFQF